MFEKYSKFRQFVWIVNLVVAVLNIPPIFMQEIPHDKVTEYIVFVIFGFSVCALTFNGTWNTEENNGKK